MEYFDESLGEENVMICGGFKCSGAEYAKIIEEFDVEDYQIYDYEIIEETDLLFRESVIMLR